MPDMDGKKKLEELVAGLDGVTPGPWFSDVDGFASNRIGAFGFETFDGTAIIARAQTYPGSRFEDEKANAAHIARCDPDTIRSISDAYKAMEAERDALRTEAGELVVAQYRISALETAITRQVKNIERWIETGEPAGPEESKSIYEQLKSALEARHEG